ncbi:MAG: class II aldolase/adducin family protein, partial [Mogibacterium sp.]|nr:class II aldolase/adducin family protein [Mogibacterium sp.]
VQIAEKNCEAENHGKFIGGTVPIDPELAESLRQSFQDDYTKRNEESHVEFIGFDEDEFALRSQLIEYGKNLVRKDLAYGSWGNLSVRLNQEEMLITPSSMDYFEIKPEDIVRVNINTLEYGDQRVPSSEAPMHAAIYRKKDDADAIIHTHSNAISVFAACEKGFALSDPAMKELIGDILITDAAPAGSQLLADAVCAAMEKTHACIIPHHGAVFYGPSLELVFAIAEAVELKARNLLSFDGFDPYADVLDD